MVCSNCEELAGRLARTEGERDAYRDLARLHEKELAALKAQITEVERRLKESRDQAEREEQHCRSIDAWYPVGLAQGRKNAYNEALDLLGQAQNGELKVREG